MDSTSLPRSSFSSSIGDSAELEGNLTLSDRLKVFKASHFDPDAYVTSKCQTMNEKEIRHLCSYMVQLKKASAEEMRKSVYANYAAFIRTSKEISDLEGELLSMRNLLSTQSALVHGLAQDVRIDSLWITDEDPNEKDISNSENRELSKIESWLVEFLDNLEVLLAERRVDEALAVLDEGESIAIETNERRTLSPTMLDSLKNAIKSQRRKLADQLAEMTCQSSTRGVELRSSVLALKKLGDGPRAHTLLLNSHQQKLEHNMQSLRSSSTSYGGAFSAALSQIFFSTVAQAASDSLAVFGEEPAYSSELVTWAVKQTEVFSLILKRHVLASSVASGVLRAATECIQIVTGHCSLLEARGLALSPVLLRLFRPSVEQALSANLRRIEQSSAALAAVDDWLLAHPPVGAHPFSSTSSLSSAIVSQPKLSRSAHRFNSMVQDLLEDVGALESLQLDGPTLEGVLQVFNSYVNLLINALPGSMENEENPGSKIVMVAETAAQQIALLANASLLADELLPRAAMKLLPMPQTGRIDGTPRRASDRQSRLPDQRELKRRLQRSVDRLRDSFCRQHALDLIFTEEGDIRLNAQIYTSMDDNTDEPEWFPSPIFQELFSKLTLTSSIATDMFVGRERFATILLMRLTETVILWLSDDQSFWEEIEAGPRPLGPFGLQQFYLDMEFVMLFSSQGRYLSRNLHQVIKNIIAKAIEAVHATGTDPYSVLPEDDWFVEVAQIAIKMLTGKANFVNVERDVTSPSASSVVSHGSN
ncbi:Vps51 domain-containing protein [Cephalotus follicularis]|uniref:Vps51 domain-containing protein n=1 Tax=Cephalotus follicularis TaxID=3775 RepID=A0A1Q3BC54_CEPFO|nr:Vps51 domain-containing protein [Cephalotus follicularis]